MVFLPNEVMAGIVYVLGNLYKVERRKISSALLKLFEYNNIEVNNFGIINEASVNLGFYL